MSPSLWEDKRLVLRGARCLTGDSVSLRSLLVRNGRIVEGLDGLPDVVLDLRDHLLLPGLVNAHDHLWLNTLRLPQPIEAQKNSYDWIDAFQPMFADPAIRDALDVDKGARTWQGGLKQLLSGVTTCAHHDDWHPVMGDPAFPVRVLERYGWSHSLRLAGRHGPAVSDSAAATPIDVPWFVHLAEGTDDVAAGELAGLDTHGGLRANTVAIHAVGLGPAALDRLVARGASVVWCPASNLLMLGATLEPRRLLPSGRLALATDSRLTGSRDLLTELQVASEVSGLAGHTLFRLVTDWPARMMRLDDVGHLDAGARADLIVLRDEGGDPFEALLRVSRTGVRAVFRDGQPVLTDDEGGRWFDALDLPRVDATLDGQTRWCAPDIASRREAAALEPGFAL